MKNLNTGGRFGYSSVGVDFMAEVASAVDSGDDMDTSVFNDDSAQQTAA